MLRLALIAVVACRPHVIVLDCPRAPSLGVPTAIDLTPGDCGSPLVKPSLDCDGGELRFDGCSWECVAASDVAFPGALSVGEP